MPWFGASPFVCPLETNLAASWSASQSVLKCTRRARRDCEAGLSAYGVRKGRPAVSSASAKLQTLPRTHTNG